MNIVRHALEYGVVGGVPPTPVKLSASSFGTIDLKLIQRYSVAPAVNTFHRKQSPIAAIKG